MGQTYDAKMLYSMREEVMAMGIPKSDAELIVDAILSSRSASWINNEALDLAAVNEKLAKYFEEKKYPLVAKVEEVGIGKFMWDIKANVKHEYFPPTF
ncbi:MAG: hypothetical protein WC506_01495 [Candidatus Micrarchaeia archaeon]